MATRVELTDIIRQLRFAPTALAPLEVAERVQHAIVKLEQLAVKSPLPDEADAAIRDATELLRYCHALMPKP